MAHGREFAATRIQSFFREVNERVATCLGDPGTEIEIVCECRRETCVALLSLTRAEYDAVRRIPTHFIVARGHGDPELELVVSGGRAHDVVEKRDAGAPTAVRLDPRRRRRLDRIRTGHAA
jgi:hypothetical protein